MNLVSRLPDDLRDRPGRGAPPGQQSITGNVIVPFLQNLVAGFGMAVVSHIVMNAGRYGTLDYLFLETPLRVISLALGAVVWGLLCLIRSMWDEVEAITITHAIASEGAAAQREDSAWMEQYNTHMQIAINEVEHLKLENKRLRQQLNAQPRRKKASPVSSVTWDASAPDPYAGDIGVEALLSGDAEAPAGKPPPALIDSDTEKDIEAANELLNHFAQHGSIGKASAYDKSNMPATRWNRAIKFMELCGAIEKDGKVNRLTVEIDKANVLIDRYVQSRMRKHQSGVHVAP